MPRKKGRRVAKKDSRTRYSTEERAQIVGQKKMGATWRQLEDEWGANKTTLKDIWKKYKNTGTVKDMQRKGRPKATSDREDRHMALHVARNPKVNSTFMAKKLVPGFCQKAVSRWTVARRLREWDFGAHVAAKKPLLSHDNIQKRFEWAKSHKDWTVDDWKRVLFSDETPFCLFQSYGRKIVWRRRGERYKNDCLEKTVKHGGGKIQVWACFSYFGSGPMYWIKDIMTGAKYREILKHHMVPHMKDIEGQNLDIKVVFQHDNDPKHTSKVVKRYLEDKELEVLNWVSQSPDINPIENGWRKVKAAMADRESKARNLAEVFEIAQEEWAKIPLSYFQGLVESMPRRCAAVIAARGGHTKY
jgi:transposase-like protein